MIKRAFLSICLGAWLAATVAAQLATTTALVGTITDTSRSLVPGATVVAVNVGTRDTYETTTNEQGYYNIQFVRPGRYEIAVSLAGFQTVKVSGIEVATNLAHQGLPGGQPLAIPSARGRVQSLRPCQLRQSERCLGHRQFWSHHDRQRHAAHGGWREVHLLSRRS